jgi:hypothetical protein
MDVLGNGSSINDGDSSPSVIDDTEFGSVHIEGGSADHIFTIQNIGSANLNLTGTPKVVISGSHASDFSVTEQPSSPVACCGATTTFTVRFDPSVSGLRQSTVSIANDDSDENPYDFAIQGTGTTDTTSPSTTATPAGGTYSSSISVTLTCDDGGGSGCAGTYYTIDGSNHTTSSSIYSEPVPISEDTTLKFFSVDNEDN